MKATNDNLNVMPGVTSLGMPEANLLFRPSDGEELPEPSHFVMTYTFQAAAAENPDSHGIRELESPLSDY